MSTKETRVLLLEMIPNWGTRDFIKHTSQRYTNVAFFYSTPPTAGDTWESTLLDCIQTVQDLNIDVVISLCDRGALVAAAMATKIPRIKASSFEGFYLTLDKTLARELIIPNRYSIPFRPLKFDTNNSLALLDGIISDMGLPVIAKPANGTTSLNIKILRTRADLSDLTDSYEEQIRGMLKPMLPLINTYLDCDKYKSAPYPKFIIEQYIDRSIDGTPISTVDGLVCNGKFKRWAIVDNRYWNHLPEAFLGLTIPSILEDNVQEAAWECLEILVTKLKPHGFNNQFIDAEFFVFPDGSIKVMEINGRIFNMMCYVYDEILENGNQYKALIDLNSGQDVPEPHLRPNMFGMFTYITVFKTGKLNELLNFDLIPKIKSSSINIRGSPNYEVTEVGATGHSAGSISFVGTSFQDCCRQMDDVKSDLFKDTSSSPWFTVPASERE